MPNRIVREALLDSDRWLGLRDNTARVCFLAAMLKADDLGNLEGTDARLRRLWRDYGVETDNKVALVLQELADTDLVRVYDVDGKRYLHIPRFRQYIRHIRQRHPASPWDDTEKIQRVAEKTQCERNADEVREQCEGIADEARTHPEEKRREEKQKKGANAPDDPDKQLWDIGLQLLTDAGMERQAARRFLGKHYKADKDKLARLIGEMAAKPPIDPVAYLQKTMTPQKRKVAL
jgi:hypothetical protein